MTTSNMQSQVKRFVAPNMRRALDLVSAELGPEAVILSSKKVKEGVEIITSLEPDLPTRGIDVRREFGQKFDTELDRAMGSDSAWRAQADIEKAASAYSSETELNGEAQFSTRQPSADLAREIEKARERMFEAKRNARVRESTMEQPLANGFADPSMAQHQLRPQSQPEFQPELQTPFQPQAHTQPQSAAPHNAYSEPMSASPVQTGATQNVSTTANRYEPEHETRREPTINHVPSQMVQSTNNPSADQERLNELQSELADMRMLLEQQLWRMQESSTDYSPLNMQQQIKMPNYHNAVRERVERIGLSDAIANQLMADAGQHQRASDAWRQCMAKLSKLIPVAGDELVEEGGVFAFVGQTGVGKTTSIAKLAANYVLKHGPGKVALITTDTYRVGAYDQLRSIGRILNVPVKAVDGENSLLTLLAKMRNYPLILIDTAGFRYGDPMLKNQLNQIDACSNLKKILVLSSTSQLPTMKASIHAFSSQKPISASVITKLDETASIGEAISVVVESQLPVAYTTDGQEIPKDIHRATGHGLVAKAVVLLKEGQLSVGNTASN